MKRDISVKIRSMLKAGLSGLLLTLWLAACSSGPAQSPEKFVRGFMEKHLKMVDSSVSDYYINDEKPIVKDRVNKIIQSRNSEGTLDSVRNAVYDLSKINVQLLDQKEMYVNDEPKHFAQVEANGEYMVTTGEESISKEEDEIFILQAVGKEWKVTEKINPWK